jgi:hypothetical protein
VGDVLGALEGFAGQMISLPKAAKIIGTSRQWLQRASSPSGAASLDVVHKY